MSRCGVLLVGLLCFALAAPVNASLAESASSGAISYQFDGETHEDAPDECAAAASAWSLPAEGSTDGMLVPPDDMSDAFVFEVSALAVGSRQMVRVSEAVASANVEFSVLAPGCAGNVLDPEFWPTPFPVPPTPGVGQKVVKPENLNDPWTCDSSGWTFLVSKAKTVPSGVHAAFTNGTEATIPLSKSLGDGVYLFTTTLGAGVSAKGAWVVVPEAWSGVFAVKAGPCAAVDGGAVYGLPPEAGDDWLAFTPIEAGSFVVRVGVSPPTAPATSMTLSCHFCFTGVEELLRAVSYNLSARTLSA